MVICQATTVGDATLLLMPTNERLSNAILVLRRRIKEIGLNQTELAQRVGRVQSWVSSRLLVDPDSTLRYLAYKDAETLAKLLDALQWSLEELNRATGLDIPTSQALQDEVTLDIDDLRSGTRTIPVYDLLSAGAGVDGGTVIDVVDIPVAWEGHYAAYQVTGDSMAPDIPDGARVVIRVQDYASPGNEIVVWVPDHGMLVKRLERITPDGELVLTSYNPEFKPIWARDVRIYGVVVEVRLRRKVVNGRHGPN
jgi:SOS-response transcriptional repressor LexA